MTLSVRLPEAVVDGRRLGRNIDHDPRSLDYTLPETPASAVQSVAWERHIPILDQDVPKPLGSCTGNAEVGALASGPLFDALAELLDAGLVLDETLAVGIYSDAEKLDGGAGLPSEDQGSSGLSVAKVGKTRGYISGYQHATSVAAAHTALAAGPFITGTYWFSGMDTPSREGIVTATGTVRGGHEYVCREYDAVRDLWWMDNSWSDQWGLGGRFAYDTPTFTDLLAQHGDVTALVPLSKPAPTPTPQPAPPSDNALRTFAAVAGPWAAQGHRGANARMATATRAYLLAAAGQSGLHSATARRGFAYIDAGTGHFVSATYAAMNPDTTVRIQH